MTTIFPKTPTMKTTSRWLIAAGALAGVLALPADAYNDVWTHPLLTSVSAGKSAIHQDPKLLFRLGISPDTRDFISAIMARGAYEEDLGNRALNHFYDPRFDRPLTIVFPLGKRSWEWMVEFPEQLDSQDRSLADARDALHEALTFNQGAPEAAAEQRSFAMGRLFQSLGHVAHHMQDMAQPQHVRNDDHLDKYPLGGFNPFYRPSLYESYTVEQHWTVFALGDAATPVFPGPAAFKTARDFWFNESNTGIAQFTNQNFVSAGTNFTMFFGQVRSGDYSQPVPGAPRDFTVEELYAGANLPVPAQIRTHCGTPAVDCTMTMYPTDVSPRASTLSIFDQHLRAFNVTVTYVGTDITPPYQADRIFALNRFNLDEAHRVLIGKAVGYSAGIINHFFRGKLEVAPPAQGAYAVVDHSAGGGFTTLRAKVTNATPGEALTGGSLMAIARFHRNNCYEPDLSGEFTQTDTGELETPCADYRSTEEHIRVTTPETMAFADAEAKELTFTFADPIPFDATDLILQVYYQGKVGEEEKTFALGAVDISEPTFVAVMNATDVFELPTGAGGEFFYHEDIREKITESPFFLVDINGDGDYGSPPDVDVVGGDIRYGISVNGKRVGDTLLPEGRFARLAALVDPAGLRLTLVAQGNGYNQTNDYELRAKQSQLEPEGGSYVVSTVAPLRNHTMQFDSVTYFHFYLSHSADLKTMPKSLEDDAATPVAIQVAGTPLQSPALRSQVTAQPARPKPQGAEHAGVRVQRASPHSVHAKQGLGTTSEMAAAVAPL